MTIDKYYCVGNSDTSEDAFYKKYNYSLTADASTAGNNGVLVDFSYAEKRFYGRVDRYYVPIVVSRTADLTAIAGSAESPQEVLPFVADAFNDLKTKVKNSVMSGQLPAEASEFLTSMEPRRAYVEPKKLYDEHMNSFLIGIKSAYIRDNIRIKDFNDFIDNHFINTLKSVTLVRPYTMTAFVKHRMCPILVSGLAIEVDTANVTSDKEKVDKYLTNPSWAWFVNACRSYGFSIDKNVPWRLVADIGSSEMVSYATRHSYYSTDMILAAAYEPAHIGYYEAFVDYLTVAYNYLISDKDGNPVKYWESQFCQDGTWNPYLLEPEKRTADSLRQEYGEAYFLRMYLNIRLMEEEVKLSEYEEQKLIDDVMHAFSTGRRDEALVGFERVIAKTYKKNGSLTNRLYGAKLRKEEALVKDDLDNAVSTYR